MNLPENHTARVPSVTFPEDNTAASNALDATASRLVDQFLMAASLGLFALLVVQLAGYSASLERITGKELSVEAIMVARIAASIVVLFLVKELILMLIAGSAVMRMANTNVKLRDAEKSPLVSIVVPAYNEQASIAASMKSLMALDYPALELIVVDDGSQDQTRVIATRVAAEAAETTSHCHVSVLHQENRGKWAALNAGFAASRGEFVLCVDADSQIDAAAICRMIPHMDDPEVGAVSGQVQIANQCNVLTRLQALEYLVTNGCARAAQAVNACVLIVPGPIGLFRRTALQEVCRTYFASDEAGIDTEVSGPFSPYTFAEDFEISVMLCAMNQKIAYEPTAISRTRAPETIHALANQRYRWLRGSMQVAQRCAENGWARHSNNWAFRWWIGFGTTVELFVMPLAGLFLLAAIGWSALQSNVAEFLALWVIVWLLHSCIAALFIRSHNERFSLCLMTPLQSIYSVMLVAGVWPHAVIDHLAQRDMRW